MRVLVTGSRDYYREDTIASALTAQAMAATDAPTVIEGACPSGADAIAHRLARSWRWPWERYPADWRRHGKAAGHLRNQVMVDSGPDVCLAFFATGSANRGTSDCVARAMKAGIRVFRYDESELLP